MIIVAHTEKHTRTELNITARLLVSSVQLCCSVRAFRQIYICNTRQHACIDIILLFTIYLGLDDMGFLPDTNKD